MDKKILTLCIIHQGNKVLLGMKKRGFGQGKWNGFGGKVAPGESIEEAAKRELLEEAGIRALDLDKIGILSFSWEGKEEDILEVNVFRCTSFTGDPAESEEMKPRWFHMAEIPYENMWSDDKHWFPSFLEGKKFTGKFIFDNHDNVLKFELN